MKFFKMHGIGNDFIVTHEVSDNEIAGISPKISLLCDRRRGVGADGMIFILSPESKEADYRMRIFNSDASEAEMCGNGIRCFYRYLYLNGMLKSDEISVETGAGLVKAEKSGDGIRVVLGPPILNAPDIPVAQNGGRVIDKALDIDGKTFAVTAVSMGNPHAVIYTDRLTDDLVSEVGRKMECHPFFPNHVNVEFVKVISDKTIEMRVFERGCGETMACGTGACAAVVAGILNNKHGNAVTVHLLGGDLFIEWDGHKDHPVFLTGPAEYVYKGEIDL